MRPVEIKNGVWWVGAVDWNCRDFHGYMVSPRGTTYNAFLVKDEKTVLFDTVKATHSAEFFDNLSRVAQPGEIDYLVVNHVEPDHSGALPEAIERIKPKKIICSPMAKRAMLTYYHREDWPFEVVETGKAISIGKRTIQFLETRMLHWPDNMASYIPEEKILVSSDAFGQNWATGERFADEVCKHELKHHLKAYYANIVLPYSPVAQKTLDAIEKMGLDIDMVLPDHGLMFRGQDWVKWVFETYRSYIAQTPRKKAVIAFDTMWRATERMAEAIAEGLVAEGASVRVMHVKANHHSEIMTELMDSAAFVVGSPTHNNGVLPLVSGLLTYVKGLRPQGKIGGFFGSYGWSGESVKVLEERLTDMKMELVAPGVKIQNAPDRDKLEACFEYGRSIGRAITAKLGDQG